MRRFGRVDKNQAVIVKTFRDMGATVQILSAVGDGVPDLLVGYKGLNMLVEVKDGSAPLRDRQLTPAQVEWLGNWEGKAFVIHSVKQVEEILNAVKRKGKAGVLILPSEEA